ncbi:hypothetical protein Chor_003936 [Crotalus horridus]
MKCCRCDSRIPHAFNSHRVENVLSSTGHKHWWQSQNDVKHVSLQLDLNNKFQLANLLLDFRIKFNPVDLLSGLMTSQSQRINNLAEFTNLRINFTQFTRFPHQGYRLPSAFYALNEMQVHGNCVCQHNTAGPNCDHCASFYNDQPWRPAEDDNPNECRRCNCNGHSHKCHFDLSIYQANGGKNGGVCEDCQHNTAGRNCELCKINFFRNRRFDLGHPEVCLPCECDPDGTVPDSSCDRLNGHCVCKENVQGDRCHLCKPGFTQLTNSNPQGCHECACNILGSRRNMPCDDESGRCFCLPNVVGEKCDECAVNHWKIASGEGCWPCNCHPQNSLSLQCNQMLNDLASLDGDDDNDDDESTEACDCNFQGTEVMGCNKLTGSCLCRSGFTGPQCNQCQRGYCGNYHHCEACHPCFQAYDDDIQRFGLRQAALKNSTQHLQIGTITSGFNSRLLEVERKIQHIQQMLDNPLITEQGLDQVANTIATIRQTVEGLSSEILFEDEVSSLSIEMDALDKSLHLITEQYQNKKAEFEASRSIDLSGAFKTIRSAHLTSSNASVRIADSSGLLAQSLENRRNAERLESGLIDPDSGFEVLQNKMAVTPNLTPVINKVCSVVRSEVCTPSECIGYLCPHQNANECSSGLSCRGILALSGSSIQTARKTAQEFRNFNSQLQGTEQMIRAAEITSSKIQTNAQNLRNQMSIIRTQIEADIQRTQQSIRQVRSFLTDPDVDATTIQLVSNYILSLNLPIDTGTILSKITEIQNLIAKLQCPDSIIAQTAGDIAKAKQLQREAEEARNQASTIEGNVDDIQTILTPTQVNVRDITNQLDSFTETLVQLQHKANQNQVFEQLNGKYIDLKRRMGQGSNLGIQGDRIQTAHTEANTLLNEALNMMAKMAALETELQESNNEFILKSARLEGLEKKVETIRDHISQRVAYYASCTD